MYCKKDSFRHTGRFEVYFLSLLFVQYSSQKMFQVKIVERHKKIFLMSCKCWSTVNRSWVFVSILAGDSAGANLNIGVAMKCIELGIRPPAGLFLAYVPVFVSIVPSPSRLLCLMDPLLPFGFMIRCMKGVCFHVCICKYHCGPYVTILCWCV